MDSIEPARDRCAEHNLAVGPDGRCVLCKREGSLAPDFEADAPRPAAARWFVTVVGAAVVSVAFLGGVALAKGGHTTRSVEAAEAPVVYVEARPAATLPAEPPPRLEEAQPQAREVNPTPAPPPVATAPAPQRNYLDEAYAQMDKRGLYDTGAHANGPTSSPAPTARKSCPPRIYNTYRLGVPMTAQGGYPTASYGVANVGGNSVAAGFPTPAAGSGRLR